MKDDLKDDLEGALEALKDEVILCCKNCGYSYELYELSFYLEISENLDLILQRTIFGFDHLKDLIELNILKRDSEAMLFFVKGCLTGTIHKITIRIGIFKEAGTWFGWM